MQRVTQRGWAWAVGVLLASSVACSLSDDLCVLQRLPPAEPGAGGLRPPHAPRTRPRLLRPLLRPPLLPPLPPLPVTLPATLPVTLPALPRYPASTSRADSREPRRGRCGQPRAPTARSSPALSAACSDMATARAWWA